MEKITITLEVTPQQLVAIATLINGLPELHTEPTSPSKPKQIQTPAKPAFKPTEPSKVVTAPAPKPGGKVAPKMPGFGRTQTQVNEFLKKEHERVDKLDEKAQLAQQRAEEKSAREAIDLAEANKAKEELEAIKSANLTPTTSAMPTKLWNL